VREGQIVGEGFHQFEWREHAEIVALKSAGDKAPPARRFTSRSSLAITPGARGPAPKRIIAAGVQRIVAAVNDPNPRQFRPWL